MKKVINHKHLSKNGDLYCVTDVHGDLDLLVFMLKSLGFREGVDTLVSVGDMADRGDRSYDTLQFFRHNPDAIVLEGNHEKLMQLAVDKGGERHHIWVDPDNGGDWSYQYSSGVLKDISEWTKTLPLALELNIDDKYKLLFMHASYPLHIKATWEQIKDVLNGDDDALIERISSHILWERKYEQENDERCVDGVDAVVHGHTIQDNAPRVLGNRIYADTGGFISSEENGLTLLRFKEGGELMGLFDVYTARRDPWAPRSKNRFEFI